MSVRVRVRVRLPLLFLLPERGLNIWRMPVSAAGQPAGLLQQLTTGAAQDVGPVISPDGRRLAFSILRQNADIWRLTRSVSRGGDV